VYCAFYFNAEAVILVWATEIIITQQSRLQMIFCNSNQNKKYTLKALFYVKKRVPFTNNRSSVHKQNEN